MPSTEQELEATVLGLPPQARARLLERLLASFDPIVTTQDAWVQLASARKGDVTSGAVALVPGSEAMARVRARLP